MPVKYSDRFIQLTIVLIGCLLFVPFLGNVHLFDWDEINFAEAAREMLVTKNWITVQINFQPFWEKPPLFIWMQALSMKAFGVTEFAARLPNALCGVVSLVVLFRIGRYILNSYFGLLWVLMYACSILPFFYFKSGIIDPVFNLFIFLGIFYAYRFNLAVKASQKNWFAALAAFFIGLGILTKGPVALLVFGLTISIFVGIKMFKVKIKWKHVGIFTGVVAFTGGFWFILQIVTGHWDTVKEFFVYQVRLFSTKDAGHGGFLLYHFVVLFLGVFPASIYALRSFSHDRKDDREKLHEFKTWMMILFWTVLILFTIVKTKIVHYSSLCYFPLTFLAAYVVFKLREQKAALPRWIKILTMTVGCIWGLVLVGLQLIVDNKDKIIALDVIKDPFAVGNLQAHVQWSGFEYIIGIVFVFALTLIYGSRKLNQTSQVVATLLCTLAFTYCTVCFITPRIEGYSQRAAIEFYKEKQKEDCYVEPMGFKSYAQLFYLNKQKPANPKAFDNNWLLTGDIDKPVYFVVKNTHKEDFLNQNPKFAVLYEKNGFVFIKRELTIKSE
jgi:4-amino-4-deoxy-L-arabinose transferase-like glycosyltransferase